MAQPDTPPGSDAEAPAEIALEGGTYEIIRGRLTSNGTELRSRVSQLNESRKEVFGSIDTELIATERLTTEHNCVPRDVMAVGPLLLFGYNVHFGLKKERHVEDVFSVYDRREGAFHRHTLGLLANEAFHKDFMDLYRYYKDAVFTKFFLRGPHLYMVFQAGKSITDIKTFKWLLGEGELTYIDARSDHEVRYPSQHEFDWVRTHRDLHQEGEFPHVSIEDRLFVQTIAGDLTVKVENNTAVGAGIYSEPVDDPDQNLDDAEIFYAIVGNIILLRIRPFGERDFRYMVFNEKLETVIRLDSIEDACVLLPDDHGLIFSNGYYLQTGAHKIFDSQLSNMMFEKRLASSNGEDHLYVFHNRHTGMYVLLQYNVIEQKVQTPLACHGYTIFETGELMCFSSNDEPQKHHSLQIWKTPYVGENLAQHQTNGTLLSKIGNKEIVRGMAECHEIMGLIDREEAYSNLYVDLVRQTSGVLDGFFWINEEDAHDLGSVLTEIKSAASLAVEEFDKVRRVKAATAKQTAEVQESTRKIINTTHSRRFEVIDEFVESLSSLRSVRGAIISLRDLRYVDEELVARLDAEVIEQSERLARRCVDFLLQPQALTPYTDKVAAQYARIDEVTKGLEAKAVEEEIEATATELEMLIEVVSNLQIDDATQRTTVIDRISEIFATLNQTRAALRKKSKELMSVEGVAEFNSQMKLLNQGVVNYLDISDSPERCEEFLTKVMIQLEELEGRFAEFDEFVVQLAEKRDEVYNAFETRKLTLVEARNKRADALMSAAERILKGVKTRVDNLESINDINAYFASDLMIDKVRNIIDQLEGLEDAVKVGDIQSQLKTLKEDAVRQLKDRQDLFVEGENIIRLGNHHFSVNAQALELTTIMREHEPYLHLTGTGFFEQLKDQRLLETRAVWDQEVISENPQVYRAEYLALCFFREILDDSEPTLEEVRGWDESELLTQVQAFMGPRYSEGYVKGVHDHDAARILAMLLELHASLGLLRYAGSARALATVYWHAFGDAKRKSRIASRIKGFGAISTVFPAPGLQEESLADLRTMLSEFVQENALFDASLLDEAAAYLFHEIIDEGAMVVGKAASELLVEFESYLRSSGNADHFSRSLEALLDDSCGRLHLLRDWLEAFVNQRGDPNAREHVDEIASVLLEGGTGRRRRIEADVTREIDDLRVSHPVIDGSRYRLHYNDLLTRTSHFQSEVAPQFARYVELKRQIVEETRDAMRLDEFRPRVLTSFVRNKLLDQVYLPLIGDNLAKQIGVVGAKKRTDLMGLLLLVSPPGYGKTTLMEYIANRLGIIFMKINGPAIGHHVTSLDPTEAPNAGAREEVQKLNLALEMGDNVMIYVDDIQHCNPEFLQKFISLCDAQRKIEGVYKGRTRTYDLRGRRVCVVMAGNPYTESGEKFQIPDMLSNRADVYNLGEMTGDNQEAFDLSFLENCLTSNPTLSKLATRSQKDVYGIIRMAESDSREGVELEGSYSAEELNEFVATMKKLIRVRDVILAVNREYIRSAAQADDYRTEPPFKLQGSYRNMNRMAEKIVPIMNDAELESLILSSYENDSQTLTSDTEANMLKFKELTGLLDDEEAARWANIKRTFTQNVKLRGVGPDDKVGLVIAQMSSFSDGLDAIRSAVSTAANQLAEQEPTEADDGAEALAMLSQVSDVRESLDSVREAMIHGLRELRQDSVEDVAQTTRLITQISQVGEALDAMRQGITQSLDQMGEELAKQPVSPPAPAAAAPAAATPAMVAGAPAEVEVLPPGSATVRSAAAPGQLLPPKIEILNRIPRSLLKVLQHQFDLMQGWMVPTLQATQEQSVQLQELRVRLDTCLDDYRQLIRRLDARSGK